MTPRERLQEQVARTVFALHDAQSALARTAVTMAGAQSRLIDGVPVERLPVVFTGDLAAVLQLALAALAKYDALMTAAYETESES